MYYALEQPSLNLIPLLFRKGISIFNNALNSRKALALVRNNPDLNIRSRYLYCVLGKWAAAARARATC